MHLYTHSTQHTSAEEHIYGHPLTHSLSHPHAQKFHPPRLHTHNTYTHACAHAAFSSECAALPTPVFTLTPTHKGCTPATIQTLIHTHTHSHNINIYIYTILLTCLNVQLFTPVPVSSTGVGYNCDHIVSVR